MKPAEAARLLGLSLPTTEEAVLEAYRLRVKADHPDTGGTGTQITALKQARDILVDQTRGVKPACPVCSGAGVVRSRGFKPVACPKGCKVKEVRREPVRRR